MIQVNNNGHLTFNSSWRSFSPQRFPLYGSRDIIAAYWTDLDNRQTGHIYYSRYISGSTLQQATQDINEYFPGLNFSASWVFVATWYNIPYIGSSGSVSHLVDRLILIVVPVLMHSKRTDFTFYSNQPSKLSSRLVARTHLC